MRAVKGLQNGKAPVIDSITAELLKADMAFSASEETTSTNEYIKIWQNEKSLKGWRRELITKLAKKGNTKHCNNWRGKTVLSVLRQAGYRKGRGDERTGIYCGT